MAEEAILFVPCVARQGEKPLPLILPEHDPARMKFPGDVDYVMSSYLTRCGWELRPPGTATAARAAMFLAHQIPTTHEDIRAHVWSRVMPKEYRVVPSVVAENQHWKLVDRREDLNAEFWCKLFRECVICPLNPALVDANPFLSNVRDIGARYGVADPALKIFPLAFMKMLAPKELQCLLEHAKFQRYLYGCCGPVARARAQPFAQDVAALKTLGAEPGEEKKLAYEDAWVMLISAAYFRMVPLVVDAVMTGHVPARESVLKEAERAQAIKEAESRAREQREKASITVAAPRDDGEEEESGEPPGLEDVMPSHQDAKKQ